MENHTSGRRVAVFGGGPAGMTVAHELAERGFEVDLYERHDILGGKVRSFGYPNTGAEGRPDLPGNMGGHFFFDFYRSIGDTLGRIPTADGGTVLDRVTTQGVTATIAWGNAAPRIPSPSIAALRDHRNPFAVLRNAPR